jgi:hypothetical protein
MTPDTLPPFPFKTEAEYQAMTDTLPPLPTSQMNVEVWDSEVQGLHQANAAYFTADQMREYARLAVKQERENCAKLAESDEFYGNAVQHAIAAAIRNQP